jgi:hypothetical protein
MDLGQATDHNVDAPTSPQALRGRHVIERELMALSPWPQPEAVGIEYPEAVALQRLHEDMVDNPHRTGVVALEDQHGRLSMTYRSNTRGRLTV